MQQLKTSLLPSLIFPGYYLGTQGLLGQILSDRFTKAALAQRNEISRDPKALRITPWFLTCYGMGFLCTVSLLSSLK